MYVPLGTESYRHIPTPATRHDNFFMPSPKPFADVFINS